MAGVQGLGIIGEGETPGGAEGFRPNMERHLSLSVDGDGHPVEEALAAERTIGDGARPTGQRVPLVGVHAAVHADLGVNGHDPSNLY